MSAVELLSENAAFNGYDRRVTSHSFYLRTGLRRRRSHECGGDAKKGHMGEYKEGNPLEHVPSIPECVEGICVGRHLSQRMVSKTFIGKNFTLE